MHEIHPQKVCCRQWRVPWLYGVLTSAISTFSVAIMHRYRRALCNMVHVSPPTCPSYPPRRCGMSSPASFFFRNRRYPAIESQSRSKLLGMWSCRRSFFNGKCCEGSPSFRACFHQQQVYCHIDRSCVNGGSACSN